MPEPITLAVVGAMAITEGVKFLYGQAGELLKRWRERKDRPEQAPEEPVELVLPPDAFEGSLEPVTVDWDTVAKLGDEIKGLRRELGDYAEGIEDIDTGDPVLLKAVDTLRQTLEAAYGQRITFRGEDRPASGTRVTGTVEVDVLRGMAAAVSADSVENADVNAVARATTVEPGAELYGGKFGRIGP